MGTIYDNLLALQVLLNLQGYEQLLYVFLKQANRTANNDFQYVNALCPTVTLKTTEQCGNICKTCIL